jgi:hypothetical protein
MTTVRETVSDLVEALGEEDVAAMAGGADDLTVSEWLTEGGSAPDEAQSARLRLAHDALDAVRGMGVVGEAWFSRPAEALGGLTPVTVVRMGDAALLAAGLRALRAAGEPPDRRALMGEAMVREASRLALIELGARLGVERSRVEAVDPAGVTILRTLVAHLHAVGWTEFGMVATIDGHQVTVDLTSLPEP